jgi:hypothetical protein
VLTLEATLPIGHPPAWAVLERRLFDLLDQAVEPFLERYTRPDGRLIWRESLPAPTRDGADDFYEAFYNWPLLYLLGGGDALLPLALRQWEAVTGQLTDLGLLQDEYERGYDQFHQSESYTYFYFLCLADPTNPRLVERARRFADLYLSWPNYDAGNRLIRAPHNGSGGPRPGIADGERSMPYRPGMARYGLPYHDLPGIATVEDLQDTVKARRMGEAVHERMGRGDVAANLGAVSLVANACLLTGDERYRRWVVAYVGAWVERARANGGLLPDNVGLSGQVGEYLGGKWYGGLYGWTWPHGFYNLGMAAHTAASCALLLTGDSGYLDLPRAQLDRVMALGKMDDPRRSDMSLREHWVGQLGALPEDEATFLVPYRHGDHGWFDYQPLSPVYPAALWNLSRGEADWARIEALRERERYDWGRVLTFRTKEDAGHEQPWLRFLAGANPTYPERILTASLEQVGWRLDQIRADRADLTAVHIHHWQQLNPVTTEALVQLTLGAPQHVYNGGLLLAPLRYDDAARGRPGLPPDVAALVRRADGAGCEVELLNLSPRLARRVRLRAGAFSEHRFTAVSYTAAGSDAYPGTVGEYAPPPVPAATRRAPLGDAQLEVRLPPGRRITLSLEIERWANAPRC